MKKLESETYDDWTNRVRMYEHGYAMQRIALGEGVETVLEEMANRILEKLLHPLYGEIKAATAQTYDAEKSKSEYQEKYLKIRGGPVADQIDDEIFDKPE
jgi:hypothetical protein